MELLINYMVSLFLILFIFGIQPSNLQVTVDEKEIMLKNGIIFLTLLKMPTLFLTKWITMEISMQTFLRAFFQLFVKHSMKIMDPLIFIWMEQVITNGGKKPFHLQMQKNRN